MNSKKQLPFELSDAIIDVIIKMHAEEESQMENIIEYLKEHNFSQLQTVFILTRELGFKFQDANLFVMNSKAWN